MYTRVFSFLAFVSLVSAHGAITAVRGANGITGAGMGIDPNTPRDGTAARPFQQDTSIIRDREIQSGKVGPCGRTSQKGAIDMAAEMEATASAGIPSATESGEIQMTLHQVNQDGAGPYTCDISADGGNTFQAAKVNKNVPGAFLGLSTATAEDFPLNVQMPAGMQCTGGPNGDACVVRCRNATPAGPFGSCAVVTNAQTTDTQSAAAGAGAGTKSTSTPTGTTGTKAAASGSDQQQSGFASGLKKLLGGRALAKPEDFVNEDAKNAELEAELIKDLDKQSVPIEKKRVLRSRVVGSLSGYWI